MIADPMETDLRVLLDREDEAEREQRWLEFTAWVQQARAPTLLRHVADLMDGQRDPYYRLPSEILDFAETEKFSGVLVAMARAMRDSGQ